MKKMMNWRRAVCAAAGMLLFFLGSVTVNAGSMPLSRTGFFFDTVITVSLYDTDDEEILDECFTKMAYYESIFSRTVEGSDVWRINHANGESVEVSEDTARIIEEALKYCELSDGAFDITIAPVVSLWNFHEDGPHMLPDPEQLSEALSHVDYRKVKVEGTKVTLEDPEAEIDLGAIAKGYISDGVRDVIRSHGCGSALINLGGNVLAIGKKPEGTPFKIGIRRPFGENEADLIAVVGIDDMSVITSGTYERYFELDGKIYHHILEPETGYSVENGLTSVTILSKDGTDGDALSTTVFLLGPEKGMELIESLEGVEAMMVDEDERIICSSGWPEN